MSPQKDQEYFSDGISDEILLAALASGSTQSMLTNGEAIAGESPTSNVEGELANAALVDVAIDQGGCFETSRATTHQEPSYEVEGIIHYCVANMPGGVARTSTLALTNATLPFVLELADKGAESAMTGNAHLLNGLNVYRGVLTIEAVAKAQGLNFCQPADALNHGGLQVSA